MCRGGAWVELTAQVTYCDRGSTAEARPFLLQKQGVPDGTPCSVVSYIQILVEFLTIQFRVAFE